MSSKQKTPDPARRKQNPTLEKVQKIADINATAFARVLRGWLRDSPPDKK